MLVGVVSLGSEGNRGRTPGWDEVASFAQAAEARGLDSVWMFDHFLHQPESGPARGQHEAWTILSSLAATTTRIQLGTLVLCTSFRNPGVTAKMAATLDEISGGRLILGVGAGWHEPEYTAFGYPFDHRVTRFEESLGIIGPLLRGERVALDGRFESAHDAVLSPAPSRRIPILVAADGPRMLRIAARDADAWATAWYGMPERRLRESLADFEAALADMGRDPASVQRFAGIRAVLPDVVDDDEDPSVVIEPGALAQAIDAYATLGFDHLIVGLEPKNEASLDALAGAVDRSRR
jgi:probable F420-dependent oxidoreductase